jgi:hypothetical protein
MVAFYARFPILISMLLVSGLPHGAGVMGRKIIATTLRYSHLSPDHKREAMEALEDNFRQKVSRIFTTPPCNPFLRPAKTA